MGGKSENIGILGDIRWTNREFRRAKEQVADRMLKRQRSHFSAQICMAIGIIMKASCYLVEISSGNIASASTHNQTMG